MTLNALTFECMHPYIECVHIYILHWHFSVQTRGGRAESCSAVQLEELPHNTECTHIYTYILQHACTDISACRPVVDELSLALLSNLKNPPLPTPQRSPTPSSINFPSRTTPFGSSAGDRFLCIFFHPFVQRCAFSWAHKREQNKLLGSLESGEKHTTFCKFSIQRKIQKNVWASGFSLTLFGSTWMQSAWLPPHTDRICMVICRVVHEHNAYISHEQVCTNIMHTYILHILVCINRMHTYPMHRCTSSWFSEATDKNDSDEKFCPG
jgi:hypothetical protein